MRTLRTLLVLAVVACVFAMPVAAAHGHCFNTYTCHPDQPPCSVVADALNVVAGVGNSVCPSG